MTATIQKKIRPGRVCAVCCAVTCIIVVIIAVVGAIDWSSGSAQARLIVTSNASARAQYLF